METQGGRRDEKRREVEVLEERPLCRYDLSREVGERVSSEGPVVTSDRNPERRAGGPDVAPNNLQVAGEEHAVAEVAQGRLPKGARGVHPKRACHRPPRLLEPRPARGDVEFVRLIDVAQVEERRVPNRVKERRLDDRAEVGVAARRYLELGADEGVVDAEERPRSVLHGPRRAAPLVLEARERVERHSGT
jgi:hypothetical protein